MAYDIELDILLKEWYYEPTGLKISVRIYNKGKAKLQFGPRIYKKTEANNPAQKKAGRLELSEIQWINAIMPEILIELEKKYKEVA